MIKPLTTQQAAIVSAYTGYLVGSFSEMQSYIEKLMGHPVWTHQLADKDFVEKVKAKAKPDFLALSGGDKRPEKLDEC